MISTDINEGRGAVLNEAMNSGCAIVASHATSSVPFLVDHGVNGITNGNGDIDDLCTQVRLLLRSDVHRQAIGAQAYATTANVWNAEVALKRFFHLSDESLIHEQYKLYNERLCSRAYILKIIWFILDV